MRPPNRGGEGSSKGRPGLPLAEDTSRSQARRQQSGDWPRRSPARRPHPAPGRLCGCEEQAGGAPSPTRADGAQAPGTALTMYSMLEAGGYTWPRSLLCSMRISSLSDLGMALLTREGGASCWYLLSSFSKWVMLGRKKPWAPHTRSSSPKGTRPFRVQLMAPAGSVDQGDDVAPGRGLWGEGETCQCSSSHSVGSPHSADVNIEAQGGPATTPPPRQEPPSLFSP